MGRIRTIKPEFPQSESMGKVSREARLLFIQLWTLVDDQGRTRAASKMLASLLYPYDTDAAKLIDKWLGELESEFCIVRYSHAGKAYLQISKWSEHQKIDKPSKPKIVSPEEAEKLARAREDSRVSPPPAEDPREDSSEEGKGREGTEGKEKDQAQAPCVFPNWLDPIAWKGFEEMRKRKRSALTDHARELCIRKLETLKRAGHDPTQVLNQSTMHGWQGLFELKGESSGANRHHPNRVEQAFAELAKAGVTFAGGGLEGCVDEVRTPPGGSHGRDAPGVVLEGVV